MPRKKWQFIQSWKLIPDLAFTLCVLIIFIFPYSLLWLYSHIVKVIAKIRNPDLISLTGSDSLLSLDVSTELGREGRVPDVKQNIGWILRIKVQSGKNIGLKWIQDKFSSSFLQEGLNGRKEYPNLFTYLVMFGGYTFRKPVTSLDINHQIYECKIKNNESLEDFACKWLANGFKENTPMWKMTLITDTGTVNENVILFKLNHSCGDGYNLVHVLDTLTDNTSPYLVKDFEESLWDKVTRFKSNIRNGMHAKSPIEMKYLRTEENSSLVFRKLYLPR